MKSRVAILCTSAAALATATASTVHAEGTPANQAPAAATAVTSATPTATATVVSTAPASRAAPTASGTSGASAASGASGASGAAAAATVPTAPIAHVASPASADPLADADPSGGVDATVAPPPLRPAGSSEATADDADGAPCVCDVDEFGILVGTASLLLSSTIGGTIFGKARGPAVRNVGAEIVAYGFAAAPFAAHLPSREYLRGFAFSATPLVMAGATTTELALDPTAIDEQGSVKTRVPYALFFTFGMVSSVVGIVDAAFASKRRPDDSPPIALSPSVSPHGASLMLGGAF